MTRRYVTDEQYGSLQRRLDEVARRVDEGTIPFRPVMNSLQSLIEDVFYPDWKTIRLGTGLETADDFWEAIDFCGMKISTRALGLLDKPAFRAATEEIEVDLVVLAVAELGFEQAARRSQIYSRAREFGLPPCSPEVGPQLRRQFRDQPNPDRLFIAMEPITDSYGRPYLFSVEHDVNGLWLDSISGAPDDLWIPEARWVFVCPRK